MKKILVIITLLLTIGLYGQGIKKDTIYLNEFEVSTSCLYQATYNLPITFKNITQKDLSYYNYGQEPSQILSNTPSMTSYTDAGSGWGYSYIRLRGIDQTRINMTLNGVPLNEPEDQGCYFSNYPDFLQSVDIIQIQRGTGMTKNGVASYAGSINFESLDAQKVFEVNAGIGSFNSGRFSVAAGSKNIYARITTSFSDGYKYHSGNKSNSLFLVSNHKYKKHKFKVVGFSGKQKNELAWLGVKEHNILFEPKYNINTKNEKDEFTQSHLQLHHTYIINSNSSLNSCIYYNYLKGWYTYQYDPVSYNHASIDTVGSIDKYNLKSNMLGIFTNYIFKLDVFSIYTGLNGQLYEREHNGQTWFDVNEYMIENSQNPHQ